MLKAKHDIFALIINFLRYNRQLEHIALGLFDPIDTTKHTLAKKLTKLLDNYALRRKIIAYVKDEGSTLNTMTTSIISVICWD
jgi:hypothetical protein